MYSTTVEEAFYSTAQWSDETVCSLIAAVYDRSHFDLMRKVLRELDVIR